MNPATDLTEEDSDYDPFARWRPGGMTVDDNIGDELDGEQMADTGEDLLSQFRPTEESLQQGKEERYQKENPTFKESAKDYAKQFTKEGLIGLGGTWGDLAELAGLPQGELPGQKEKHQREFETLEKMKQPGYQPSIYDIAMLTDDSEGPGAWTLPTSKGLREFNDLLGGPGEPETTAGRYGARQGKLVGSGVATGQLNPVPGLLAGAVGQRLEELGAGETAQTIGEIVTLLLSPGGGSKGQLGEKAAKQVKDKINQLRKLGYSDEEITLAINSASKGKKAGVKATKGAKTEAAFEKFGEKSADLVSDILQTEIPGIERGVQHVHQIASDFYGQVAREGANLVIKDSTPFINSATRVVKELRQNLGNNPEAGAFLNRLYDAVVASTQQPTARNFMEFYKELNKMGSWIDRSSKDRLITMVKDGIKDTFRSEGPAGRKFAQRFEEANAGIAKAYKAQDVHDLLQKTVTQEGTDFKKMYKLFDKPDNVHLMEEVLGTTQTNNLRQIAKTSKEVKDFDKAWKSASLLPKSLGSIAGHGAAYYLYSGNWIGLAAMKGGEVIARKLAEKSLTDPRFQNLMIRGIHAVKNNSPRTLRTAIDEMQKYLDDEGIKVNLIDTKE